MKTNTTQGASSENTSVVTDEETQNNVSTKNTPLITDTQTNSDNVYNKNVLLEHRATATKENTHGQRNIIHAIKRNLIFYTNTKNDKRDTNKQTTENATLRRHTDSAHARRTNATSQTSHTQTAMDLMTKTTIELTNMQD